MKKYFTLITSVVFTILLYFLYVVDNIVCAFGIGAKLPFKDFVEIEFYHRDVYIRFAFLLAVVLIYLYKTCF